MKLVQDALKNVGIPVFAAAWRPTEQNARAPDTYIVYTTMTLEAEHWDDENRRYKVFVYLNLWSKDDPTSSVSKIRKAMRTAGFGLSQEIVSYDDKTGYVLVSCTWIIRTEDEDGTED